MAKALTAEQAYIAAFDDVREAIKEVDAARAVGIRCDYSQMVQDEIVRLWQLRIESGQLPPIHAPHVAINARLTAEQLTATAEVL